DLLRPAPRLRHRLGRAVPLPRPADLQGDPPGCGAAAGAARRAPPRLPDLMDAALRAVAEAARGFMPPDEGLALHEAGLDAARCVPGAPLLEVGSYCGKSSVYLGAAAK